jgi:SAM-dependent methyltransferase
MIALELSRYRRRIGVLLHRTLSPRTFQFIASMLRSVRSGWWTLSSYFPRLIASRFIKRTPQVLGFGAPLLASQLAKELQSVNLLAPTKICRVMTKYGSDKSRPNNYTPLYSMLFKERRGQLLRIFELGLGTNNPDAPSNMGVFGAPGASLRAWRELLPYALVYGADIDRNILFQENRIKTFYCDQLDQSSIRTLWSLPDLQGGVDIIIEDGLHTFEANVSFLEGSLHHLRPGGIYIIEDIMCTDVDKWYDRLGTTYSKRYPEYDFAFVVLSNGCNLLVIRRSAEPASPDVCSQVYSRAEAAAH